jgi:hypothetical protein
MSTCGEHTSLLRDDERTDVKESREPWRSW